MGDLGGVSGGGLNALQEINGVLRVGLAGDHIRAITEHGLHKQALQRELKVKGVKVTNLIQGEPTLEDVFLSLAR